MKAQSPITFSVVMPVYNAARYLDSAVSSVLAQSFGDFELILVNDGSADESPAICRRFEERDQRVKVIDQENSGPGAAMNVGVHASTGEWIVVMHADDLMMPDRLEVLKRATSDEDPRIGLITSSVELIGAEGSHLGWATPELPSNPFFLREDNAAHIVGGLYHPAVAVSRVAMVATGGYDPNCRVNEDVEFFNRLVEKDYGIRILHEALIKYRIHVAAASCVQNRSLLLHWRFLKRVIIDRRRGMSPLSWEEYLAERAAMPRWDHIQEWRKDMAKIYYRQAAGALSGRNWTRFAFACLCSFALQPSFIFGRWLSRRT